MVSFSSADAEVKKLLKTFTGRLRRPVGDHHNVLTIFGTLPTLTLQAGGELNEFFNAVDATFNLQDGIVGRGFGASRSEINISGGSVGNSFFVLSGSTVNISDGSVGFNFNAFDGSTINISGGLIDRFFAARNGSVVNLFGTEFFLDGVLLDDLLLDQAFTITDRNVVLSGLLADGTPFDFELSSTFPRGDFFDSEATLTVTRVSAVPEPGSCSVLAMMSMIGFLISRRRK